MKKIHIKHIQTAYIDENLKYTPFRVIKEQQQTKTRYTDHRAIITKMNWKDEITEEKKSRTIMTKVGYRKYKDKLRKMKVSNIWDENEEVQYLYNKWNEEIMKVKETCMTRISKTRRPRTTEY